MPISTSPSLRALLGCAPSEITLDGLRRLIESVPEGPLLDYKADAKDPAKDLAKDVAAFANAGGGVIIIGVAEDKDNQTFAFTGLERSGAVEERIRQSVAPNVFPYPIFDLHWTEPDAASSLSALAIHIPASNSAPHAVYGPGENGALSFPIRDGIVTRNMREPEISARYRERFYRKDEISATLNEIWNRSIRELPPAEDAWLAFAVVPTESAFWVADNPD